MSVIYPGDVRVPDAMHVAFQTMGVHPVNGEDVSDEVSAAIEALPTDAPDTRAHAENDSENAVAEEEKAAKKAAKK